jgi:DNA polymerase III psi subunit
MSQIDYLNAMGISTWVVKDEDLASNRELTHGSAPTSMQQVGNHESSMWTFVVDELTDTGNILFDKILASLMLSRATVQVVSSSKVQVEGVKGQVVVAMGATLGKTLLGLSEPFNELRGAVHSLEQGGNEVPVVLTYHPDHLLKNPLDKIKTWQDLILARSLV